MLSMSSFPSSAWYRQCLSGLLSLLLAIDSSTGAAPVPVPGLALFPSARVGMGELLLLDASAALTHCLLLAVGVAVLLVANYTAKASRLLAPGSRLVPAALLRPLSCRLLRAHLPAPISQTA